jgi:hypothetical protein
MSNLESYTELSIQIATLDMKLSKILELLNNKPEKYINIEPFVISSCVNNLPKDSEQIKKLFKDIVETPE